MQLQDRPDVLFLHSTSRARRQQALPLAMGPLGWCIYASLVLVVCGHIADAAPAKAKPSAKTPPKGGKTTTTTTTTTTSEDEEGALDSAYQEHIDDVGLDLACSACAHTARSLRAKLFAKEKPKMTKRQREKMMDGVLDVVCDDADFPATLVITGESPNRQYVDGKEVATEKEFKVSRETVAKNLDKLVEVCETLVEQHGQTITDKVLASKENMASFNWEQEICVLESFKCEKTLLHSDDEFTPAAAEAKRAAAEKKKAKEEARKAAREAGEEYKPPDEDEEEDEDMAEIRKGMKKGKRKAKAPAPTYCAPNDARCQGNKPSMKPVPKKKPKKNALAKLITNVKERQAFISEVFEHELECWKLVNPTLTSAIPPAEKNLEVAWNGLLTCGRKNHPAFRTQNLPDCSPLTLLFGVHTISILAQRHSKLGTCCRTNSGELLWERPELHEGFVTKGEGEDSGPGPFQPALLENRLMHTLHKLVFIIVEQMKVQDDSWVSDTLSQHRGSSWQKEADSADYHAKKAKCPDPWEEPSEEGDGDDADADEDDADEDEDDGDEDEDEEDEEGDAEL